MADALHARAAVEAGADGLVRLHERVQLLRQVLILPLQHPDMRLQSLYLSDQLGIRLVQMHALEAERFGVLTQNVDKILSLADGMLQFSDLRSDFLVASGFTLQSAL